MSGKHIPGTLFCLRIPIPLKLARCLQREYDPMLRWKLREPLMEHWLSVPEYDQLKVLSQRVSGFDLAGSRPWMSVVVEVEIAPDDDLKMLLLMKYDMSDRTHAVQF